jgi:hypothetical protein
MYEATTKAYCTKLQPLLTWKIIIPSYWPTAENELYKLKDSVSPDFLVFFIIYDIKSVLSVRMLMVLKFFYWEIILIFKDEVLMYMAQNVSWFAD